MRVRTRIRLHDEHGVAGLMIVIVVAVIIGLLSFAIDGGGLFLKRRAMVNANDAAALAAALSCSRHAGGAAATASADQLAAANVANAVEAAAPVYTPSCDASGGKVTVHYQATQRLFFAQIVGVSGPKVVSTTATATWGGAGAASNVSPLMLDLRHTFSPNCDIPNVPVGTICYFWWDNSSQYLGNAAWGLMNLAQWDVSPTAGCSNAGQSSYKSWLLNGFPGALTLNNPPPTYVCRDSGFFGGALDNDIQAAIDTGQQYAFPVNDPNGQIDKTGHLCPPPACTPDKYDIVGFAFLKPVGIYKQNDSLYVNCAAVKDSNARCLAAKWVGYSTSGVDPGGGGNYGVIAVGLSG
jgi:Flp pilus assembly protein TadG